jgi:hypothetical protein
MFIGDNGSPGQVARGLYGTRGAKGSLFEGGTHVPMIVQGPGVSPGRTNTLVKVPTFSPVFPASPGPMQLRPIVLTSPTRCTVAIARAPMSLSNMPLQAPRAAVARWGGRSAMPVLSWSPSQANPRCFSIYPSIRSKQQICWQGPQTPRHLRPKPP